MTGQVSSVILGAPKEPLSRLRCRVKPPVEGSENSRAMAASCKVSCEEEFGMSFRNRLRQFEGRESEDVI